MALWESCLQKSDPSWQVWRERTQSLLISTSGDKFPMKRAFFSLVRDGSLLKQAFVQDYLNYMKRDPRGMATGEYWPCEHGPDLSRNCKALKTWMTIKTYGTAAMGDVMANCCHVAQYLVSLIEARPELELLAPVALSIVEQGIVAPSFTFIHGKVAIRAAIVNHRTRE
eukprot:gene32372-39962_t